MNKIFLLAGLMMSLNAWGAGDVGIFGRCHDGSLFELSLSKTQCHSSYGVNYLVEQAFRFCSEHCSPQNGKCAVNRMQNIMSDCEDNLPEMYRGFNVVCQDGSRHQFNTCSVNDLFMDRAQQLCAGKVNAETGIEGISTFSQNGRCN